MKSNDEQKQRGLKLYEFKLSELDLKQNELDLKQNNELKLRTLETRVLAAIQPRVLSK